MSNKRQQLANDISHIMHRQACDRATLEESELTQDAEDDVELADVEDRHIEV